MNGTAEVEFRLGGSDDGPLVTVKYAWSYMQAVHGTPDTAEPEEFVVNLLSVKVDGDMLPYLDNDELATCAKSNAEKDARRQVEDRTRW